jgi:hypothetical protein
MAFSICCLTAARLKLAPFCIGAAQPAARLVGEAIFEVVDAQKTLFMVTARVEPRAAQECSRRQSSTETV